MTRQERELRATAHHEAGHAVASWRCGMRFKHVTIKPGKDSLGHMLERRPPKWFNPEIDPSDRTRLLGERHIITSLAGQIAETKFRGRKPRFGMHSDNKQAVDMATYFSGSSEAAPAFLDYLFVVSWDLLDCHWWAIESVAAALLAQETLSHEETVEVIMPGAKALKLSPLSAAAKAKLKNAGH